MTRRRVLLVNAFHWLKGGVERTYLDESRWLAAAGHDVAHFAIRDARNLPSPTAEFFAPPTDFGERAPLGAQLAALPRAIWSAPAARGMERLIAAWRPDIAHLHAPSRYLSPSILRPLERAGVPVVMTLHDFKPWCTNRIMLAHGEVCTRCRGRRHWQALATGCVQDSRARSAVGMVEAYVHDALDAYRAVRLWLCPSRWVEQQAIAWGAAHERLRLLAHGVEPAPAGAPPADLPERFALFAGRLSFEKGVHALPAIASRIAPVPLLVAGDGPLAAWLESQRVPNLRRLGHLEDAVLAAVRARASVVVVPSRFVEHFGYTVAEALLDARPVVAARIGALPELVTHEQTGLLAEPGDEEDVADLVARSLADPAARSWGEAGRARVRALGDPAAHVKRLLSLYDEAARG